MATPRRLFIGLVLLFALGSTATFGATMCMPGSLAMYTTPGFTCTEDGGLFTYKNFTFTGLGPVNAASIQVIPKDLPANIGFMFSGTFAVAQGGMASYTISYFVDPPPIIHGEQIELDPMGSVDLFVDLCLLPFNPTCPAGQTLAPTLHVTTVAPVASTTFGSDTSTMGVKNTLSLNGAAGPATSGGFSNGTILSTPEPASILLAASGLLGLLALRSRAKLRKTFF